MRNYPTLCLLTGRAVSAPVLEPAQPPPDFAGRHVAGISDRDVLAYPSIGRAAGAHRGADEGAIRIFGHSARRANGPNIRRSAHRPGPDRRHSPTAFAIPMRPDALSLIVVNG